MYAKLHADIPLSPEDRATEVAKFKAAVARFAEQMECRLIEKLDQGWRGWDDPKNAPEIYNIMLAHGAAIPLAHGQEIDIGNFAMFLWHMRNPDRDPLASAASAPRPAGDLPALGAAVVVAA